MKHRTSSMVATLAWAVALPARAQEPSAAAPPAKSERATPPSTPAPAGPPSPTPAAPGEHPELEPTPENIDPPAPPPSEPVSPLPPRATPPNPALVVGAAAAGSASSPASKLPEPDTSAGLGELKPVRPLLGLALGTPDTGVLPGRFRPAFGLPPQSSHDYQFDFHGYLNVPLRLGFNTREHALSTQHTAVLHGPPLTPDDFERFEHVGVVPQPWVQLGFAYGNSVISANIIIAATSISNASGFLNPPTQLGINDAFLTFKPEFRDFDFEVDVGGFANRYGAMGDYDLGRYDTPVIARVGGVGETMRFTVPFDHQLRLLAEHGFMGQWDRAPLGVEPAGWNSFSDPLVGTSFAHHAHLGLALHRRGQLGLHYVNAFTHDDRAGYALADGSITVLGADLNTELAPLGRFFIGAAATHADNSRNVSGVIRVLNTFGGPGLMREYLGPRSQGTGRLTTLGAQYDLSLGEVVRGTDRFSGYAPDVFLSAFGMFTQVKSDDLAYTGIKKLKYGAEVTYSALAWFALSGRYDRVVANTDNAAQTFAVISPRLIFRTDYNAQDQVTLQYSHWFDGSDVVVRNSYAPCTGPSQLGSYDPRTACGDPSIVPDSNTVSLTASMWW